MTAEVHLEDGKIDDRSTTQRSQDLFADGTEGDSVTELSDASTVIEAIENDMQPKSTSSEIDLRGMPASESEHGSEVLDNTEESDSQAIKALIGRSALDDSVFHDSYMDESQVLPHTEGRTRKRAQVRFCEEEDPTQEKLTLLITMMIDTRKEMGDEFCRMREEREEEKRERKEERKEREEEKKERKEESKEREEERKEREEEGKEREKERNEMKQEIKELKQNNEALKKLNESTVGQIKRLISEKEDAVETMKKQAAANLETASELKKERQDREDERKAHLKELKEIKTILTQKEGQQKGGAVSTEGVKGSEGAAGDTREQQETLGRGLQKGENYRRQKKTLSW